MYQSKKIDIPLFFWKEARHIKGSDFEEHINFNQGPYSLQASLYRDGTLHLKPQQAGGYGDPGIDAGRKTVAEWIHLMAEAAKIGEKVF